MPSKAPQSSVLLHRINPNPNPTVASATTATKCHEYLKRTLLECPVPVVAALYHIYAVGPNQCCSAVVQRIDAPSPPSPWPPASHSKMKQWGRWWVRTPRRHCSWSLVGVGAGWERRTRLSEWRRGGGIMTGERELPEAETEERGGGEEAEEGGLGLGRPDWERSGGGAK